jgi:hypothetical protein
MTPTILLTYIFNAVAGNWETVGGNSMRNGQSDEIGPASAVVVWEGAQSAWFGGQVYIWGDKLVTMRFQGISDAPIVCHGLASGAELWNIDFPGANSRSVPRGFRDNQVYATNFQETGHDTLFALDPSDSGRVIWRSEKTVDLGIVWATAYDSAGNLIIPGSGAHITKISKDDGHIMWDIARAQPNTGAEGLCVFGNTIYGWTGYINTPKKITAWDLSDGHKKYSSMDLPGDGDQEISPTIGPDGTIYALRDGGLLYALRDNGSGFDFRWAASIGGTGPTVQFGIGRDSSVYVPDGRAIARLSNLTGQEIDRSPDLVSGTSFSPRITVDIIGTLYVINGEATAGMLYALTPELDIIWAEPLPYNYYSGPALGEGGALAVAGNGDILRVYNTETAIISDEIIPRDFALMQNYPNPFNAGTTITYNLRQSSHVRFEIFNSLGQLIKTVRDDFLRPGTYFENWNGIDNREQIVGSGVYFYRLRTSDNSLTMRMIIVK